MILKRDVEAEKGLISSVMKDPKIILPELSLLVRAEMFFEPAYRLIWNAMEAWNKLDSPDFPSLAKILSDRGQLEEVGNRQGLDELWSFVSTGSNWRYYLDPVLDAYRLRTVQLECQGILDRIENGELASWDQSGETIEKALTTLATAGPQKTVSHREGYLAMLEALEAEQTGPEPERVRFNLLGLDQELLGLEPGDLCVISAETSGGKTALALQCALYTAIGQGKPVAVFSLKNPLASSTGGLQRTFQASASGA